MSESFTPPDFFARLEHLRDEQLDVRLIDERRQDAG